MNTSPVIGVVGLTHLGVVSSIGLASFGYDVRGFDTDEERVRLLQQGDSVFPEPLLQDLFTAHRDRTSFASDFSSLDACDIVVFGQDTFITEENEMDLHQIHVLLDAMIPHLKPDVTILFMSQVPVGFTRKLHDTMTQVRPGLTFHLFYWVDVLVVGDAVARFQEPGRIMIGHTALPGFLPPSANALFARFSCPVLHMSYESAELTKSAVNVFLATTVTFANELSNVCEAVGADMTHMVPALRLDKRIGPFAYIKPGLGFSGGHLERDLVALSHLAEGHHVKTPLIDLIQSESARRYHWLRHTIDTMIFSAASTPTIALWGLSYKKNTDSTHGAPSLAVIRDFAARARLVAYDPLVVLPLTSGITCVKDMYEAVAGADGVLVLSDWDTFKAVDPHKLIQVMKKPLVIDPLGVLVDQQLTEHGISYVPMGRSLV